jgi:hypothetical protein
MPSTKSKRVALRSSHVIEADVHTRDASAFGANEMDTDWVDDEKLISRLPVWLPLG